MAHPDDHVTRKPPGRATVAGARPKTRRVEARVGSSPTSDLDALQESLRGLPRERPNGVRLHRAVSWLRCARDHESEDDLRFMALWIAFNACYAGEDEDRSDRSLRERQRFRNFLARLVEHDRDRRLYDCLWREFPGPVRALVESKYLFMPFWDCQRTGSGDWERRLDASLREYRRLMKQPESVVEILCIVLDRLYVLRNQVFHGGATWQSRVNRSQVRSGAAIMAKIVPIVVDVMHAGMDRDWGRIEYPVVEG